MTAAQSEIEILIRDLTRRDGPLAHEIRIRLMGIAKAMRHEAKVLPPSPLAEARTIVARDLVGSMDHALKAEALGGQRERIAEWRGNAARLGSILRNLDLDSRAQRAGDCGHEDPAAA